MGRFFKTFLGGFDPFVISSFDVKCYLHMDIKI